MNNKKKLKYICMFIIVFVIFLIVLCKKNFYSDNNEIFVDQNVNNESKNISIFIENGYQTGDYFESDKVKWWSSGYVFNEQMSYCENGSSLSWNESKQTVDWSGRLQDKCYVYFDKNPNLIQKCVNQEMSSCFIENHKYDFSLIYHDGLNTTGDYVEEKSMYTYEAGDNSYRYFGSDPDNYVCFGSNEATCPNDNLYRIIGIFNNSIKIIKADVANTNILGTNGGFDYSNSTKKINVSNDANYLGYKSEIDLLFWKNVNRSNNWWKSSELNNINLNINYLNNIGNVWSNFIKINAWKVGGNTKANIVNNSNGVKGTYISEVTRSGLDGIYLPPTYGSVEFNAKVGLMYVSDYMYAASPKNWNKMFGNEALSEDNWMNLGVKMATITRNTSSEWEVFSIKGSSDNTTNYAFYDVSFNNIGDAIRPTFYLNSNVILVGGDGTKNDPYRLGMPSGYVYPRISGATYVATENTLTVNVSPIKGTNNIINYYYSINNGPLEIGGVNQTFSGLTKDTSYSINIYAVDTLGVNSNVYNLSAVTCFDGDTLIALWDRKRKRKLRRKIKKIKKGDIIYTYDYVEEKVVTSIVKEVHISKTKEICHVFMNGDEIKTTRDHGIYVYGLGFVNAGDLQIGYDIVGNDGMLYKVEGMEIEVLDVEQEMYSIELEDGSSFMCGKNGIVSRSIYCGALGIAVMMYKTPKALASAN